MTVGVNARLTPKLLNSTEMVGNPLVTFDEPEIGTGNSPPARKLAVWPDIAVKFGCARLVMNPSCSRAAIVAWAPGTLPTVRKLVASPITVTGLLVMKLKLWPIFCQLTPISFSFVTFTSAIRTCRLTWFGVATVIRLITCDPLTSPAIEVASARTLSAFPASDTTPFSTRLPSTDSAETRSPGASRRRGDDGAARRGSRGLWRGRRCLRLGGARRDCKRHEDDGSGNAGERQEAHREPRNAFRGSSLTRFAVSAQYRHATRARVSFRG